jgi:hypothetical protein
MNEIEKIQEAEYFLDRMTAKRESRDAFRFNLSAFLSAARSVLQYAREEVRPKPGGLAWYDSHMANNKVLKFFKDKRDINIHVEPVVVRVDVGVQATERIRLSESVTIDIFEGGKLVDRRQSAPVELETESEPADQPATTSRIYRFGDWSGGEDVFQLSATYLNELKHVVAEGQQRAYLP